MILTPASAAPGATITVSGRAARRRSTHIRIDGTLVLGFTTGNAGTYTRTVTVPSRPDGIYPVIVEQLTDAWRQVDHADLTIKGAPPVDAAPVISAVTVTPNSTGADVAWHVSEFARGWIRHGLTPAYGQETVHETSFAYQDHAQSITGYGPGVPVFYAIVAEDTAGQRSESAGQFTTTTPIPSNNVVTIPASIETAADPGSALMDFFATKVPNGSRVIALGTPYYRYLDSVRLTRKEQVNIDIPNATLDLRRVAGGEAGHLYLDQCKGIRVAVGTYQGANPKPGFFGVGEHTAPIYVSAGDDIEMAGGIVRGVVGDATVTINRGATNIRVHDVDAKDAGRNAISVVNGSLVTMERCKFGIMGWALLDIEPEPASNGLPPLHGFTFRDLEFAGWNLVWSDTRKVWEVWHGFLLGMGSGLGSTVEVEDVLLDRITITGASGAPGKTVQSYIGSNEAAGGRRRRIVMRDIAGQPGPVYQGFPGAIAAQHTDDLLVQRVGPKPTDGKLLAWGSPDSTNVREAA